MSAKTDFNDLARERGAAAVAAQIIPLATGLADWPEPIIGATVPPEIPADALPGWLGRYVGELAAATQTPATLSVAFALSVAAACVQRRYLVQPRADDPDYTESASVWSLSVASSGARKSAIVKALTRPLEDWEKAARDAMRREIAANRSYRLAAEATIKRLQAQAGKSDDAAERERLREQIAAMIDQTPDEIFAPRVFLGDTTMERLQMVLAEQSGRAAVLADEAGLFSTITGTYGGGAGPSLDVLLQGYSGGAVRVERATRTAYVDRAAVTLGLMLQPGLLNEAAGSNRFRASGLLARFLYAVPGPFVGGRDVRRYARISDAARTEYDRSVKALLGDPKSGPHLAPHVLPLDAEACDLWLDFAQEVEDALAPGGALAAIDDWGAKLAGTAARIALLFELITSGADAEYVTAPSTVHAIALCRMLVPHARAAFHLLGADETARDVDAVLGWIRALPAGERGGFKQATLHYAMRSRFIKKDRLVAALQRLQASACIRYERHRNDGARATDFWYVNPRLFLT